MAHRIMDIGKGTYGITDKKDVSLRIAIHRLHGLYSQLYRSLDALSKTIQHTDRGHKFSACL